jgi:outer membrane protein TolC
MIGEKHRGLRKPILASLVLCLLSGCATVDFRDSVTRSNREAAEFTKGDLRLAETDQERSAHSDATAALLRHPLSQDDAVRLALLNSRALQALLAGNWVTATGAAQVGRIPNPLLTFSRIRLGDEIDIERTLAFGLLDLLTLPQRYSLAQRNIERSRVTLTADVVEQVTKVRRAWINAVAAQQNHVYARQVLESAEASGELARRMQAAGNFSKLARARQQVFYADAATAAANAQHRAVAAREELVRLLGLSTAQAVELKLPERFPDLPATPRESAEIGASAAQERLDIRIAQLEFQSASAAQGLNVLTSITDIEVGVRRDTKKDRTEGSQESGNGFEASIRLPLFDWGDLKRDAMNARTLAAINQLEATVRAADSKLRQDYSAYRTAYDVARHYRQEVLPLRKAIADENVLRYNGMIIGVFELLADAREQVSSVMAALDAERNFWLADAALKASLMGKPIAADAMTAISPTSSIANPAAH